MQFVSWIKAYDTSEEVERRKHKLLSCHLDLMVDAYRCVACGVQTEPVLPGGYWRTAGRPRLRPEPFPSLKPERPPSEGRQMCVCAPSRPRSAALDASKRAAGLLRGRFTIIFRALFCVRTTHHRHTWPRRIYLVESPRTRTR